MKQLNKQLGELSAFLHRFEPVFGTMYVIGHQFAHLMNTEQAEMWQTCHLDDYIVGIPRYDHVHITGTCAIARNVMVRATDLDKPNILIRVDAASRVNEHVLNHSVTMN